MIKIYLILISLVTCASVLPQELKVFSAVGGSKDDNYFSDGISDFKDAFTSMGVNEKNQGLYFGGPDRDGRCISTYPATHNGVPVENYRQSIANAKSCDDFRITLALRFLTGQHLDRNKDCSSLTNEDVKPASAESFLNELSKESFKSGDAVYIHLADHGGDASYGERDYIINMSNGDSIKSQDIGKLVKKLIKKNVKVQLSFDACYSGGFTDAVYKLKSDFKSEGVNAGRLLCSSSSTESKYAGYESDPLLKAGYSESYFKALKKYGNQLSAVACASGADSLNTPITTLDRFVDQGQGGQKLDSQSDKCFFDYYNDASLELSSFVKSVEDISLKVKIETLVEDFKHYFGDVMVECYDERQTEQKIMKMIHQCLPDDHQYAYLLKPFLKEAGNAKINDQKIISRQILAIRSIKDEKMLASYLDEFCCLAMPFDKNKPGPESCSL